jgi:hypothetical protein
MKELESQAKGLDFSNLSSLKKKESLQNNEEWFQQRKYKFTSSCIHRLITPPKDAEAKKRGELGEGAKTYVLEKIAEEIGGQLNEFSNGYTDWGNENEEKAAEAYIKETGNVLESVGFCQHTEFYGGSPDRSVIDHQLSENIVGALEIKCPFYTANHLWHCLIENQEYFKNNHKEYYWQCISHIITMDVQWCDFVSFDPRITGKNLFKIRIYRDEEDVKLLLSKLDKAIRYKKLVKIILGL